MINPFEYIRENTNIIEVAEMYGIQVDRNNKSFCIFHKDGKTPNMSFKDNYVHCFSCGEGGSVIDLVMQLFNLSALGAANKLNEDLSLGLNLKGGQNLYKPNGTLQLVKKRDNALVKAFNDWCDNAHSDYCKLSRYYWSNMQKYKPQPWDAAFHPLYVEAIHQWEPINYILDILSRGSPSEKMELYRTKIRLEVKTG